MGQRKNEKDENVWIWMKLNENEFDDKGRTQCMNEKVSNVLKLYENDYNKLKWIQRMEMNRMNGN